MRRLKWCPDGSASTAWAYTGFLCNLGDQTVPPALSPHGQLFPCYFPPQAIPPRTLPPHEKYTWKQRCQAFRKICRWREPVPTRVLNPDASEASYKPEQRRGGNAIIIQYMKIAWPSLNLPPLDKQSLPSLPFDLLLHQMEPRADLCVLHHVLEGLPKKPKRSRIIILY